MSVLMQKYDQSDLEYKGERFSLDADFLHANMHPSLWAYVAFPFKGLLEIK